MGIKEFKLKNFDHLRGLKGITDEQVEVHQKLYAGYVLNTNKLRETIADMVKSGKAGTSEYSELVRRLGWEYNGMRLHELYFENLTSNGKVCSGGFKSAVEDAFDGFDNFKTHFLKVASMRGVGWTILYQDPESKNLSVHWISSHEEGHPAGFKPILVCDVWEHAWTVYKKPTERPAYLEDFWSNCDFATAEKRLTS